MLSKDNILSKFIKDWIKADKQLPKFLIELCLMKINKNNLYQLIVIKFIRLQFFLNLL